MSAGKASAVKALFLPALFLPALFLPALLLPTAARAEDTARLRQAEASPLAPPGSRAVVRPPRAAAAGSPLTLAECYRLALQQSEAIAIRQELIEEAEHRFTQALSGILPRVSLVSTDKRQGGSGSSAFTLRHVPERKFTFSQPLFRGFKEFAAMAGSRAERRQRALEKARAEHLLLVDVSDAYDLVLEQQEDLRALETIRGALNDRIVELQGRERLGRSRPSEVLSAQAQELRVEAEIELARNRETTARQLLEFLTGLEHLGALADDGGAAPALDPKDTYLGKAMTRPDVRAAEEAVVVAEKRVAVARADFLPKVTADGNYYLERRGAAKDVPWDATLEVAVPLYQGGQTSGAVQEAASQARQARMRLAETHRRAVLEIRDAYANLEAAVTRTAALARAADAAEENYGVQVGESRLQLVNTLEVLQTLQALEEIRRELIHARYEAQRRAWQLKAAVGDMP